MTQLQNMLVLLSEVVWGPYVLIPLLLLTGVFLTVRLGGLQFRVLFHALWLALVRREEGGEVEGDISHYQALSTALAATIGIGNIAGVAAAIGVGGPGALFWMWVTGLLGMATKYSEALLGVKYRRRDEAGEQSGGPMFYLRHGLGGGLGMVLGGAFAVFGAIAAFGIGNGAQSGEVVRMVERTWGIPYWVTGLVLMVLAGVVIIGGIKSIGRFTALLVPVMCLVYIFAAIAVLIVFVGQIPTAITMIFTEAFTGRAATGGLLGSALLLMIKEGMARGMFSNESGLGTGAIAAAAAKTDQPVRQAMVSMTQTFIDTLIVVTMTGLTIIVTGAWSDSGEEKAAMTTWAFEQGIGGAGAYVVTISVILFAFTTLIGWSYYGERCMDYLFGRAAVVPYRIVFVLAIFLSTLIADNASIWAFADVANGLMALPNLIGLLLLSPVIISETRKYFANPNWRDLDLVDVRV